MVVDVGDKRLNAMRRIRDWIGYESAKSSARRSHQLVLLIDPCVSDYDDDIWSLLPERPPEPEERREPGRVPPGDAGCDVPAGPNFPTFIPSSRLLEAEEQWKSDKAMVSKRVKGKRRKQFYR